LGPAANYTDEGSGDGGFTWISRTIQIGCSADEYRKLLPAFSSTTTRPPK
jgi:hypothetical protein